jgi:hypothetical protein
MKFEASGITTPAVVKASERPERRASVRVRGATPALLLALALIELSGACGGDDPPAANSGGGCTTDIECKGTRICVDRQCVDPGGSAGDSADPDAAVRGGGISSGAGGSGHAGTGGSGAAGNGVIGDDPELEKACSKNCEARQAASCPMNTGSLDQCLAQCLVIDEQGYGYCLEEQTAQYACLASGGYACVSGYPQPKATCIAESQALSMCSQKAPCRRFCERAAGKCAPAGDECVTSCLAEQKGFSDALCGVYYSSLISCWGQSLTCNGDIPTIEPCGAIASEIADCIARRNHECDGFCWAAERMGCGSDACVTTCRAKADETTCGRMYRSLVECTYSSNELRMTCENGEPTPSAKCASAQQQYALCMTGM